MIDGPALRALRSLHDCGVVRASLFDAGYAALTVRGLATSHPFPQHEDDQVPRRDYRLTPRGAELAKEKFR